MTDVPSRSEEHGQHDPQADRWFCGYWMTLEEWEDVHDYAPPLAKEAPAAAAAKDQRQAGGDEGEDDDDDVG
jgi:hypothetical protein